MGAGSAVMFGAERLGPGRPPTVAGMLVVEQYHQLDCEERFILISI